MTTELEQKFYDTFGIEQEYQYHVRDMGRSYVGNKQMLIDNKHLFMDKERKRSRRLYVANVSKVHPDITAEKLLKIICILNKHYAENFQCATMLVGDTIEKIKECVLKDCIEQSQHIKSEIQQLFKD